MQDIRQTSALAASPSCTGKHANVLWALSLSVSVIVGGITVFSEPFGLPSGDLDPSWCWALHEAFFRGFRFGQEIVFSFGPFGFLSGRMYHPQTFVLLVTIEMALSLLTIWSLFEITKTRGLWFLAIPPLFLLAGLFSFSDDSTWAFMQLCLCTALTRSRSPVFGIAAGLGLALVSLTKFVFLASSLVLVIGLLAFSFSKTTRWCAISVAGGIPALWLAGGQRIADLPEFLRRSAELASGYSEAMASVNSSATIISLMVYVFSFLLLLAAALLAAQERKTANGLFQALAIPFVLLVLGFVSFKHGFVRNDCLHTPTSYATLSLLALTVALIACSDGHRLAAALAMLVCTVAMTSFAYGGYLCKIQFKPAQRLAYLTDVAFGKTPPPWQGLGPRFEEKKADIRAQNPLPSFPGNVDLISSNQGILFAHDLQWNPRPVFQSYACYTPGLISLNGEALERKGPDDLLVKVGSIDGRLAVQEDSLLWRKILDWYTVAGNVTGFAHLKRRSTARPWEAQQTVEGHGRPGEMIPLPETWPGVVLWLSIDVPSSFSDRLWSLFFKPPGTYLITDGQRGISSYRYLVAAGRAGFIISPRIESTGDFESLLRGELPASGGVRHFGLERRAASGEYSFKYRLDVLQRPQ